MSSNIGENLRLSIFGQSHSPAVGMTLDGLPAGELIDPEELSRFLSRRAPGKNAWSTSRSEADQPEFLSGLANGRTCGAPLTVIIRNTNTRSGDYSLLKNIPRPGHADYTAEVKYGGFQDYAGGGHFSGRLTAPLCAAGGICLQILARKGIRVFARILSIGSVRDDSPFLSPLPWDSEFPAVSEGAGRAMRELIAQAKSSGDSVGGVIECIADGLPAGLGDPIFLGMENRISSVVFGIPAIKGIEFGDGFASAARFGSENNDAFLPPVAPGTSPNAAANLPETPESQEMREARKIREIRETRENNPRVLIDNVPTGSVPLRTETNHCGGILGGITNGMPLVFRVAVKPTPSIAMAQRSVRLSTGEAAELSVPGRHDPCIVPRAVPCVEAAAAFAVYDAFLGRKRELPFPE